MIARLVAWLRAFRRRTLVAPRQSDSNPQLAALWNELYETGHCRPATAEDVPLEPPRRPTWMESSAAERRRNRW